MIGPELGSAQEVGRWHGRIKAPADLGQAVIRVWLRIVSPSIKNADRSDLDLFDALPFWLIPSS